MKTSVNAVLKEVLEDIKPKKEELKNIDDSLDKILKKIHKRIKNLKLNAEVFVGGSFSKNTVIKKDVYDVDIFIRFDKKYKDNEISGLNKKILKGFKGVTLMHGSRDYLRIKSGEKLFFELIPVLKVKKPEEAENITDLSYSHVKYINKKVKNKKILDDIRLAKAFCYANNCYGAESYIRGFSGYGLELLVYHYKGFLKFLRAMSKIKSSEKVIIDSEKLHKKKNNIMLDLNESKLQSPIILIDPTYKQRNVLAALSQETFDKFQKECKNFLRKPTVNGFEEKKIDLNKVKVSAKKKKYEFILLEVNTDRKGEDIAGSKLLKFHKHLDFEISRFFQVKDKGFNYNKKKSARYFFVVKSKKEILVKGPNLKDPKNVKRFKKKHKNYFTKKGRIYAKEKVDSSINKFIESWKKENKKKIKDMNITGLRIIE